MYIAYLNLLIRIKLGFYNLDATIKSIEVLRDSVEIKIQSQILPKCVYKGMLVDYTSDWDRPGLLVTFYFLSYIG